VNFLFLFLFSFFLFLLSDRFVAYVDVAKSGMPPASSSAKASSMSASPPKSTQAPASTLPPLGKHGASAVMNEMYLSATPVTFEHEQGGKVNVVVDLMSELVAAVVGKRELLDLLLGCVDARGNVKVGSEAAASFLRLLEPLGARYHAFVDQQRDKFDEVFVVFVVDGQACNDAKAALRPFDDKAFLERVLRGLLVADRRRDAKLVSDKLSELSAAAPIISTSSRSNVAWTAAAAVVAAVTGDDLVEAIDFAPPPQPPAEYDEKDRDLVAAARAVLNSSRSSASTAPAPAALSRDVDALLDRVSAGPQLRWTPPAATTTSATTSATTAGVAAASTSAAADTGTRKGSLRCVLVRGRGEADYVVAVLAASLALQSEGYVIVVSKDTDVPLEALREVEIAVAAAPAAEAGLRQRLLDSVLWTTSSADARRVPLAAFVTSDSPLLLALAALLSGRDTVSQLLIGAAFLTMIGACRKVNQATLAAAQKIYETAGSDTAAWLAPILAVLNVPGAPTTISDEYAEQLQRHDEARRAARQCGIEVALKIEACTKFDTTSAAALGAQLEESAPLLLGALKRCRSRESVWKLTKKADSHSLAKAPAPAPAQSQKQTVYAMHLHFNGDRVPRADQDRVRQEREEEKKKTARASAKTQAEAQLAAAARRKQREVPTSVAQERHRSANQRAVDLTPDDDVLAALEAKRKARLERRAARRTERDKHIAELRDAALHSSAKQARRVTIKLVKDPKFEKGNSVDFASRQPQGAGRGESGRGAGAGAGAEVEGEQGPHRCRCRRRRRRRPRRRR
jgi:hypothetical protein